MTKYTAFAVLILFFSCDKNFEEINTNEVDPTSASVDPVFLLNNAIINTSTSGTQLNFDLGIVQQVISPNSGVLTGANYNQENREFSQGHWTKLYQNVIKNTGDITAQLLADDAPNRPNLLNMTRLVEALAFMILTDEHGDVPYFEAGKGLSDQIVLPAYTPQEEIYKDLINVVKNATADLSNSAPPENGEVMYSGDINKWKRFGNSLLLRIGMRLTEVDLALAEQTVKEAFAGGVMLSNDDNYVIRHDSNYTNNAGSTLNATEANNYYMVDSFVDFLKDSGDPRLQSIAIRYIGAKSGPEQTQEIGSTDPDDQIGMPMGYDNSTIVGVAADMNLASFYAFTQVDRYRFIKQTAPMFMVTHSQTQLLLAEAAVRGWVSGDPADYYAAGVRAHMEQMAAYDPDSAIPTADIDAYLAANPFDASNALEQINDQYWVSSFMNGPEAFANFRRSGFPALTPNPYPAQDITGDFINRITYPTDEIATNNENLSAAVARMGPDNLDTKVWWDK
ncbi:SusD/RagB family nutrient-binding outer membrane lipoprotein [Pricia sp. S334]|uniref:SusD/RagB family nutrient-binding outer membrane lipoprotein n=1 Tax=Pricia mediterranea TaxID=3076079 RepID=A0ABU3LAM7_9FLAO|nr:SusD/RagB family nutrient-binding outer membrane lipoprotein [Pricia sp. S334]MDT7830341.1 SusD/RagB family nutrient-binding outer membrane lipoprotein [Pricia sp. S334]